MVQLITSGIRLPPRCPGRMRKYLGRALIVSLLDKAGQGGQRPRVGQGSRIWTVNEQLILR